MQLGQWRQDDRSMLAAHAQQNSELVPTSAATHDGRDQADDASDLADLAAYEKARRVHKRSRPGGLTIMQAC